MINKINQSVGKNLFSSDFIWYDNKSIQTSLDMLNHTFTQTRNFQLLLKETKVGAILSHFKLVLGFRSIISFISPSTLSTSSPTW